MEKESKKLPPTVVQELQAQIKKFEGYDPIKMGYKQIINLVGLGYITSGQISKIVSLYNNQTDPENREKIEVYGSKLVAFCKNEISQEKMTKEIRNKVRTSTGHPTGAIISKQPHNRSIDRMNSLNTKSTESPKILKISDLMEQVLKEAKIIAKEAI